MHLFKVLAIFVALVGLVCAGAKRHQKPHTNSVQNDWKPSNWLSVSELESLPALNEIKWNQLEDMTVEEGADLISKMDHLSQLKSDLGNNYVPEPSEIPAYIVNSDGETSKFQLDELKQKLQKELEQQPQEITIFMTGYPEATSTISKTNQALVEAYRARNQMSGQRKYNKGNDESQADYDENNDDKKSRNNGILVVVDLGAKMTSYEKYAELDEEKTGRMFAKTLVQITDELNVPYEIIHIVAQGISAHVAGAAARAYTVMTGHQLRRITALDPTDIMGQSSNVLVGLARGDAEFVDAIHTSAYGLGTTRRVGNVDFYPNGPSAGVPGADNVLEAAMRATRYFAESVRPGNERNFPAVAANSLEQYKNNRGSGRRAYMGIATEYDIEGDYILQVNPRSPFGQRTPAKMQMNYHSQHKAWRSSN